MSNPYSFRPVTSTPYHTETTSPNSPSDDSIADINSKKSIPSKRAAQNRAAQRAFRQRRDQYIKDLEERSKHMEGWKGEAVRLRHENIGLHEELAVLRKKISTLMAGKTVLDKREKSEKNIWMNPTSNDYSDRNHSWSIERSSERSLERSLDIHGDKQSTSNTISSGSMEVSSGNDIINDTSVNKMVDFIDQTNRKEIEVGHESFIDHLSTKEYTKTLSTVSSNSSDSQCLYSPSNPTIAHLYSKQISFNYTSEFNTGVYTNDIDINQEDCFLSDESDGQILDDLFAVLKKRQRPPI